MLRRRVGAPTDPTRGRLSEMGKSRKRPAKRRQPTPRGGRPDSATSRPRGTATRSAPSLSEHTDVVDRFVAEGLPVVRTAVPAQRKAEPAPAGRPAPVGSAAALPSSCMDELEGQYVGLGATYQLDTARVTDGPFSVAVRFTGVREGTDGSSDPADRFERVEVVDDLHPGSGRVTITTRVTSLPAGQWTVTAEPATRRSDAAPDERWRRAAGLKPATITTRTRLAPRVHGPGVIQFAWFLLVVLGAAGAVTLQALLLARGGGEWRTGLRASAVALVVGYLAAKIYYMVEHGLGPRRFVGAGTCIQGFLLGAFGGAAVVLLLAGSPVGPYLDATAPGVLLAMAVGRPGCFLGGCCVGRPTSSRWGLWSSDRRVGMRRIPVQLIEAGVALGLGAVALAVVLLVALPVPGALFVAALALYTAARQLLFPLRHKPRHTSTGRVGTLLVAFAVATGAALLSVLSV